MQYTSETMLVKSKDQGGTGIFAEVSAQQAGWEYLNMRAVRLNRGEQHSGNTAGYEQVAVILGGQCDIHTSEGNFLKVGRRPNVFSGMPYALYLPPHTDYQLTSLTDGFEVAFCWVPSDQRYPAKLVTPRDCKIELRGGGNVSRQINSILPPGFPCHRLVCVEVYTPSGNWSSYPPHKHDVHREDENGKILEADLEEIYFYKIDKPHGYAYQRVYTDDRSIDGLMMAQQHDMVLVPEGYHPVVSAPGYHTYYLNFLAGSAQSLANSDDPAYKWVHSTFTSMDPRLPLVTHGMEPLD